MNDASIQAARPTGSLGQWTDHVQRSTWLLPAVAALAVLTVRLLSAPGVDVSALLTWAERLVDGGKPFVDFVEVNPPGSIMLYVPGVALGRVLGISPEIATNGLVLGLIALSLHLCRSFLNTARTLAHNDRPALLAAAIVILGAMPAVAFAQREHIGIIAVLPFLCVCVAEIANNRPAFWLRGIAGLLAGLSMVAKPHFALLLAAVMIHLVLATRNVRHVVHVQWIAAGAVVAAYLAFTYTAYPEFYSTALPRISDVYLGWRVSLARLIFNPVLMVAAIVVALEVRLHAERPLLPVTHLALTAGGVAIALFYLQGRAWPYHALPAITLIALGLAVEATRRGPALSRKTYRSLLAIAVAVPALTFAWCYKDADRDNDKVAAFVTAVHPRPRMLTIAEDISIGHPLVRRVDGIWTHRVTHLWSAFGFYQQLAMSPPPSGERLARLQGHLEAEIRELARSIEREAPDIIVAQTGFPGVKSLDWLAWAREQPLLAHQLENYVSAGRVEDVEVLKRRR